MTNNGQKIKLALDDEAWKPDHVHAAVKWQEILVSGRYEQEGKDPRFLVLSVPFYKYIIMVFPPSCRFDLVRVVVDSNEFPLRSAQEKELQNVRLLVVLTQT